MADPVEVAPGRWQARIFINQHPATGQTIRYRTDRRYEADGIRRARTQARQIEADIRAELVAAHENPTPTVAQAADQWWQLWSQRNRSPTTRKDYDSILRTHIHQAPFAGKRVTDVKVGELDRWYLSLPCSPARVQRINAVLAQVFRQCERDGTIDRNPAALAHKPEARPKAKTHMPVGVLNLLLEAAANPPALQRPGWTGVRKFRSTPVRARALAFAALTGLRRGEVAGVRYSALDLDAGMLLVSRNVVVVPGVFVNAAGSRAPRAVIKDPKAHQSATIRLNPQAVEIARRQTDWQLSFLDAINLDPAELDPFLWSTDPPFDEPITPDVLTKWFRQAAKDAGISGFTFHDLRHWRGSQQLEVGGTVRDAQEALRHRSSATTMVYLHADLSKQGALADLLPVLELPS